MSRSTATSAAWSTAPASPWRRWTSSSSTARSRRTSCDVGGGAGKEKVTAAFKIITADPKVKGILVNIFGGIMKCDVIAEGVVAAVKEVGLQVPLVVRLEGTNVEEGKKIINESGLNVIPGRRPRRRRPEDRRGGRLRASQHQAVSLKWTLDKAQSGRKRGLAPNPDDLKRPEMFDVRHWRFEDPLVSGEFRIAVVRPEWVGWRQNGCMVLTQAVSEEETVLSARRALNLQEPQVSSSFGKFWILSGVAQKSHEVTRIVSAHRQRLRSGETTVFGVYELQAPANGAMLAPVKADRRSEKQTGKD
jgi:hypothetical protein